MDFEGLKKYILKRLSKELSEDLHYHCFEHTIDVMESAMRLADMENVNGHDKILIKTAALFHDLGFIETYEDHEQASVKLAKEILPGYGYKQEDVNSVLGMILSTEIPQNPKNHLEEIIADSDLDYLGRDDLFVIGQRLQHEWKIQGIVSTLRDWHEKQLEFLKSHEYFTQSAKKLRDSKKQENIKELENLLGCKK